MTKSGTDDKREGFGPGGEEDQVNRFSGDVKNDKSLSKFVKEN